MGLRTIERAWDWGGGGGNPSGFSGLVVRAGVYRNHVIFFNQTAVKSNNNFINVSRNFSMHANYKK